MREDRVPEFLLRDVKKVRDATLRRRIAEAIEQVEAAERLEQIPGITRMSGESRLFRIRVGDSRLGLAVVDDTATFVRCLHRREIYRYFP